VFGKGLFYTKISQRHIQRALGIAHALHILGVVDHARPGISRGGDFRGSIAGNVASDAAVSLDLRASVGRNLEGARPVLGDSWGGVVEEGGNVADVREHLDNHNFISLLVCYLPSIFL